MTGGLLRWYQHLFNRLLDIDTRPTFLAWMGGLHLSGAVWAVPAILLDYDLVGWWASFFLTAKIFDYVMGHRRQVAADLHMTKARQAVQKMQEREEARRRFEAAAVLMMRADIDRFERADRE